MSFLTPSTSSSLRALHQGKQDDNDSEAERDINIKNLSFLVILLMGLLFWLFCLLWGSRWCDSRHDQQQARNRQQQEEQDHNRQQQRDEQDRNGPQPQSEDDNAASPTVWDNPRMLQEYYRRSMARAAAWRAPPLVANYRPSGDLSSKKSSVKHSCGNACPFGSLQPHSRRRGGGGKTAMSHL